MGACDPFAHSEAFLASLHSLSMFLTWMPGFFCALVVIFSMISLSQEISYKPHLSSSKTYEQDSQGVA